MGGRQVPLALVHNRKARRYILRLKSDGAARVTVPRGGSALEARRFAERHTTWLERQLSRQALQPATLTEWRLGDEILARGELRRIQPEAEAAGQAGAAISRQAVRLGEWLIPVHSIVQGQNLRPEIERYLRSLATGELTHRTFELASAHGFAVRRVSVRSQRSRWGSCSRRGTISLNWRLVQTPLYVRDYLICHELAHLREMNHSARFWAEVARLDPSSQRAEAWLKRHSHLLR